MYLGNEGNAQQQRNLGREAKVLFVVQGPTRARKGLYRL